MSKGSVRFFIHWLFACCILCISLQAFSGIDPADELVQLKKRNQQLIARKEYKAVQYFFGNPSFLSSFNQATIDEANRLLLEFQQRTGTEIYFQLAYWVTTADTGEDVDKGEYNFGDVAKKANVDILVGITKRYILEFKDGKEIGGLFKYQPYVTSNGYNCKFSIADVEEGSFIKDRDTALLYYVKEVIKQVEACLNSIPPPGVSISFQGFISSGATPSFTSSTNTSDPKFQDFAGLPKDLYDELKNNIKALETRLGLKVKAVVSSSPSALASTETATHDLLSNAQREFNTIGENDLVYWMHYDKENGRLYYNVNYPGRFFQPKPEALTREGMMQADINNQLPQIKQTVKDGVDLAAKNKNPELFNPPSKPEIGLGERILKSAKVVREVIADLRTPDVMYKKERFPDWFLNVQLWPPLAGGADAGIDELKSVPELISSATIIFDSDELQKVYDALAKVAADPGQLFESFKEQLKSKADLYTKKDLSEEEQELRLYSVGKDGVVVVITVVASVKAIKDILKKIDDVIKKGKTGKPDGTPADGDGGSGSSKDDSSSGKDDSSDGKTEKPDDTKIDKEVSDKLDNSVDETAKKNIDDGVKNGDYDIEEVEEVTQQAEDLAVKKGKKLTWPEIQALFKRGNDFNAKARIAYGDGNVEIVLKGVGGKAGKRLDTYIPPANGNPGKIISRKATTLSEIQPSTFKNYLNELVTKYPKGAELNSSKFPKGTVLDGDYKLEIPESNRSFFNSSSDFKKILSDFNKEKGLNIEIIYLVE